MHVSRRTAARFGLLLATAGALTAVSAPVTTNAPIIVTASRANRTAEEMPANVTVITADAIRESGAQNVVETLETMGGLYFRHNSDNPGQAEITMRGFGENSHGRVLVLVDGQRLNTADMATLDWLRIPAATVDRIEVLHGSQTALYGNYAVAGVINITTRQPTGEPVTTLGMTFGSDNTLAGHIGHAGSVGDVRYTADADWRQGDGWRDNSDYRNADIRVTLDKDWTDSFRTDLAAFYTENRYGTPGNLTLAQMRADPRQTRTHFDAVQAQTFGGSLGLHGQIDSDNRFDCALAATRRIIESDVYSWKLFSDSTLDTFLITPRYTRDDDLAGHRNRLLIGVDLGLDTLDLDAFSNAARTLPNTEAKLNRANAGVYLQDEFWLTRELFLTVGGRAEFYRYNSDVANVFAHTSAKDDTFYRQSALDAALLYTPIESVKLFARTATLYRDPFLDELTTAYFGGAMVARLKPEIGQQYEVGASATLASEWIANLSVYRLDMEDEIAFDPAVPPFGANRNLQATRRYGADAGLTWARKGTGLASINYEYVDAFFADGANENKKIPLVPAHVVTVRGELELPFDLTAMATVRAVSAQFLGEDNVNRDVKLPTYGTLDLGLRYHPRQVAGLDLFLGVDNVFDHIYANTGYSQRAYGLPAVYYPSPGRTWRISASYRF